MSCGPVLQSGSVTRGHLAVWETDGIVGDSGTATNGQATELGITNNGNIALAISSALNPNPLTQFGFGVSSNGIATIYVNSYNGAPTAELFINLNGVNYSLPSSGGAANVVGPTVSVNGNAAVFNGTSGTLLADAGFPPVRGAASSGAGNVVVFNDTTGKYLADGGPAWVPTIAALRALSGVAPGQISVLGYSFPSDNGGGSFVYVSADTSSADNGGTIIVDAAMRRWYRVTGSQPWSILWFGGSGNGMTDNLAAWNSLAAAVAALQTGGEIKFPAGGVYLFSANAGFTFPSGGAFELKLWLDGATLYWPNAAGGMTVNYAISGNTLSVEGGIFSTGVANGGNGLTIVQSPDNQGPGFQSALHNVTFIGSDNIGAGGGTKYWGNGLFVNGVSSTAIDACTFYGGNVTVGGYGGCGILYQGPGTGSFGYSIYHNASKCVFMGLNTGITYGAYAQGVTISQSNFQNLNAAIIVPTAGGDLDQLMVSNCQIAAVGEGIYLETAIAHTTISSNLFLINANYSGLLVNAYSSITVTGNLFHGYSTTASVGVIMRGTVSTYPATISGNTFWNLGTGAYLDTGSTKVLVDGNAFSSCTNDTQNFGTGNLIGTNLT